MTSQRIEISCSFRYSQVYSCLLDPNYWTAFSLALDAGVCLYFNYLNVVNLVLQHSPVSVKIIIAGVGSDLSLFHMLSVSRRTLTGPLPDDPANVLLEII